MSLFDWLGWRSRATASTRQPEAGWQVTRQAGERLIQDAHGEQRRVPLGGGR